MKMVFAVPQILQITDKVGSAKHIDDNATDAALSDLSSPISVGTEDGDVQDITNSFASSNSDLRNNAPTGKIKIAPTSNIKSVSKQSIRDSDSNNERPAKSTRTNTTLAASQLLADTLVNASDSMVSGMNVKI